MEERKLTGLEWDTLPLPNWWQNVYVRRKKPYFDEEKAFIEAQEDKGTGNIIVAFDPQSGRCGYMVDHGGSCSRPYREVIDALGGDAGKMGPFMVVVSNSPAERKYGIRVPMVKWDVSEDIFVLRVYLFYTKHFKNYGRPERVKEIFRVCLKKGDMWQENPKGISEIPWKKYVEFLSGARWYGFYPSGKELKEAGITWLEGIYAGEDAYDPISLLLDYARIPHGDRIFRYVPEEVRADLKVGRDGVFSIPGYLGLSINEACWETTVRGSFRTIERVYVGERRVYFFSKNLWRDRFVSVTPQKRLMLNQVDMSMFARDIRPEHELKGFAGLAAEAVRRWRAYRLPVTMHQATKYLAQEQLLRLGMFNSAAELNFKLTDTRMNLKELLGVPGFVIEMLRYGKCTGLLSYLIDTREDRKALFEKAEKNGVPIDQRLFYETFLKFYTGRVMSVAEYYIDRGKNVNKVFKALLDGKGKRPEDPVFGFGWRSNLLDELADYISMKDIAGTVSMEPYPDFIKPSSVSYWHKLVTRDYNRAKALEDLKNQPKILNAFNSHVKSNSYRRLEYRDDDFSIISPKEPGDLVNEGNELCHCVGSYVRNVADGISNIYFLRRNSEEDVPYCTIEVADRSEGPIMTQCYNEHDTHDGDVIRMDFVRRWCEEKHIEIACAY